MIDTTVKHDTIFLILQSRNADEQFVIRFLDSNGQQHDSAEQQKFKEANDQSETYWSHLSQSG